MDDEDQRIAGRLVLAARDIARRENLTDSGFRIVANTGNDGGQSVQHLHFHLLGGRALRWPPG
jgi:histidine triad (HIT) family protein